MDEDSGRKKSPLSDGGVSNRIIAWFKVCVVILIGLIVLKYIGLQVFVRIDFDDESILAALTEIETYYLPLGLLLVCFVAAWVWGLFFGSKDD